MPKLSQHQSSEFTKILYIGDSGSGKTGSLAPLVTDPKEDGGGYELGILDLENGLDPLKQWVAKVDPKFLDKIDYETVTDSIERKESGAIKVTARSYLQATKLMTKWSDGSDPGEWGPRKIFVLDSTTALGRGALAWAEKENPATKDPRQWYFTAQKSFEHLIALLMGDEFKTNVIVIAHINRSELEEGIVGKWFPTAVGKALGPIIPTYFNTMVEIRTSGTGKNIKKKIHTLPSPFLDIKVPAPFKLKEEYDIEHGMAQLFKALRS